MSKLVAIVNKGVFLYVFNLARIQLAEWKDMCLLIRRSGVQYGVRECLYFVVLY